MQCGRYAPSPTGRLHLGNLRTALLSWLQTRLERGRFILRIDDLDKPRNKPGSIEQIMVDLNWLGLDWDEGPDVGGNHGPYLQSQRTEFYDQAFQMLHQQGCLFACTCSRKDLALSVSAPHGQEHSSVYPGTCRKKHFYARDDLKNIENNVALAWRYTVDSRVWEFDDLVLGKCRQNLSEEVGDFVIKRKDGQFAYHLTTVVDDQLMGVTDVVRGADLSHSTPRQLALIKSMRYAQPRFWHVPLLNDAENRRMSKRDGSDSLQQWHRKGKSAEQLVGLFASGVGLIDHCEPVSAGELLKTLDKTTFRDSLAKNC